MRKNRSSLVFCRFPDQLPVFGTLISNSKHDRFFQPFVNVNGNGTNVM